MARGEFRSTHPKLLMNNIIYCACMVYNISWYLVFKFFFKCRCCQSYVVYKLCVQIVAPLAHGLKRGRESLFTHLLSLVWHFPIFSLSLVKSWLGIWFESDLFVIAHFVEGRVNLPTSSGKFSLFFFLSSVFLFRVNKLLILYYSLTKHCLGGPTALLFSHCIFLSELFHLGVEAKS